ncbi:unnamed protein product [Rotaria socialis]|nr:unnamed protein product [Rotaria socialis]CAF4456974.1 unnamed protein product [Rotaria socialis]CAF4560588.1 unnamed protein product [Rotaria socialis]CAF4783349.1 unnamed protein product [Rotaria socialis]CAF4866813.1 unnamed protein product [Rotaria socialis]
MSTPVQSVLEKGNRLKLLWKSKQIDELLADGYAPDARLVDHGTTHKGHEELKKIFEKFMDEGSDYTIVDTTAVSDDCVTQRYKPECESVISTCTATWNKINGDWKITLEDWN